MNSARRSLLHRARACAAHPLYAENWNYSRRGIFAVSFTLFSPLNINGHMRSSALWHTAGQRKKSNNDAYNTRARGLGPPLLTLFYCLQIRLYCFLICTVYTLRILPPYTPALHSPPRSPCWPARVSHTSANFFSPYHFLRLHACAHPPARMYVNTLNHT